MLSLGLRVQAILAAGHVPPEGSELSAAVRERGREPKGRLDAHVVQPSVPDPRLAVDIAHASAEGNGTQRPVEEEAVIQSCHRS